MFTACEKQPPELVGGSELSNSVISPIEVDPNKLNTPSAHSEDTGTVMVPLSCRNSLITEAFNEQRSAVQVKGCGKVVAILPDDNEGSRHQRFIVQLEGIQPDHTVLIAHNIDLASRIDALKKGDDVVFYGQYEYNSQGGVVHWTHHDPAARHQHGWIEHKGKRFE
nr:DUF3465 domain-containing protein [Psychrobacter lutiphocae]